MNIDLQDYDFPISHGHHRALQAMHGQPVSPNVDVESWTISPEEERQQFINWQEVERAKLFGHYSLERPPAVKPRGYYKPTPSLVNKEHTNNILGGRGLRGGGPGGRGSGGTSKYNRPKEKTIELD